MFQTALSDFYVEYRLVCQAVPSEPRPRAVVLSALHANIQDVFNEHGVQIMSPHYLGDPADAEGRAEGALVRAARATAGLKPGSAMSARRLPRALRSALPTPAGYRSASLRHNVPRPRGRPRRD